MKAASTSVVVSLGATCLGLALSVACTAPEARTPSTEQRRPADASVQSPYPDWVRTDLDSVRILLAALADTVSLGGEVGVEYHLRNDGPPVWIANQPHMFAFQVIGPDGTPVMPNGDYEAPELGSMTDVVLPSWGELGQRVNLECIRNEFYSRVAHQDCDWAYQFTRSGQYHITVLYTHPYSLDSLRSNAITIVVANERPAP